MKPNKEITRLQQLAGIKPLNESFDSLVHKLEKQGKSEKAAEKIAGAVNAKYVHHYREGVEEVDEIKVNNPNIKYQSVEEIGGDEDFEDDFPNLNYSDIIKKINQNGYIILNGYNDEGLDAEDNEGKSYFIGVFDNGNLSATDEDGNTTEF